MSISLEQYTKLYFERRVIKMQLVKMEYFYNFVVAEFNSETGELWLPVGFGRKNKYLPENTHVCPEDAEKFSPIRGHQIEEGGRCAVCICNNAFDNQPLGIRVAPKEFNRKENVFESGIIFISTEIHKNILSIKVPPYLAVPLIADNFGTEMKKFEIWFIGGDIAYYPIQGGRFASKLHGSCYSNLDYYLDKKLDNVYGKTL
ncbi:hypothetical protein IJG78_03445 [Candidatus Saccharibacteria bacterium]|nr:hypothetical protein [Candidatus Saccharibacteria bacterium]